MGNNTEPERVCRTFVKVCNANEARQEAGCAYVSDTPDTTEENDLLRFYNEKHEKFTNSTYRQRLL